MPAADVLSPFLRNVLLIFVELEEGRAFYFSGGMALAAYHLHHRVSEDIDLFCPEEALIPITARKFAAALEARGIKVKITRSFGSFWEAVLGQDDDEIRVQLVFDTPFHLADFVEHDGLRVHGLADIAVGKLLALFTRAEARDFVDLYCLVEDGHFTMPELISLAKEKDPGVDEYYLAIAFERVTELPDRSEDLPLSLLRDVDMPTLKAYFREEAVNLLNRNLASE